MNHSSVKVPFVQKISYRCKEPTISTSSASDEYNFARRYSEATSKSSQIVNGKPSLALSWAPLNEKQNGISRFYRCVRAGDITYSKFIAHEGVTLSQCSNQDVNRVALLDNFLQNQKLKTSIVVEDPQVRQQSSQKDYFVNQDFPTIKVSQPVNHLTLDDLIKSKSKNCRSENNTHHFDLHLGFENKSQMTKSVIMKEKQTAQLYRSIAFQSEAYDDQKIGFIIMSSPGQKIVDKVQQYLKSQRKSLGEPFYSIRTTIKVENQRFEAKLSFKLQQNNISYNWSCKKLYPNQSYFQKKFEFFNHFRIDVFYDRILLQNNFSVEPFAHNKTCVNQNFEFQLKTELLFSNLAMTETRKFDSMKGEKFINEHMGSLSWQQKHL